MSFAVTEKYHSPVQQTSLSLLPTPNTAIPVALKAIDTATSEAFHASSSLALSGKVDLIDPNPLAKWDNYDNCKFGIDDDFFEFRIIEFAGVLKTVKKCNKQFIFLEMNSEEAFLRMCQRSIDKGNSIIRLLQHPKFNKNWLNKIFELNHEGIPNIFNFSDQAILDICEVFPSFLNPIKLVHPHSGRNLLTQAAFWGSDKLLMKFLKMFPSAFQAFGIEVVHELLKNGNHVFYIAKIKDYMSIFGLDRFYELCLTIENLGSGNRSTNVCDRLTDSQLKEIDAFSEAQKNFLYDVAYAYNYPHLHQLAERPVLASEYSINFMWINKDKTQTFLMEKGDKDSEKEAYFLINFVEPILDWIRVNKGAQINIWYDGDFVSLKVIENSSKYLLSELKDPSAVVQFRDIRSLEVVQSNPRVFSKTYPLYFRIDLLKAATADQCLRKKESKYFVFCDLDVRAVSSEKLFDRRTVQFLNEYGFVLAKGGWATYENSFQIFNGEHSLVMQSHRTVIIDLTIEMALMYPSAINEQQVFATYKAMITHLLDAMGTYGKFQPCEPKTLKLKDGPQKFLPLYRWDRYKNAGYQNIPIGEEGLKLEAIMPRKPVSVPGSHFG